MLIKNTMESRYLYRSIYVFSLVLILSSCSNSYTPREYKIWIESSENGFSKTKVLEELEYGVQFQTPEYKLLQKLGPVDFFKITDVESELLSYDFDYSFLFKITNLNGIPPLRYKLTDDKEYYGRIQYFNSAIQKDFFLIVEKKDTLPCLFAHLERDFGISPELRLQLSFGDVVEDKNVQLCYIDKLYNNGMVKFTLNWKDLKELPKLIKG